MTPAQIKRIEKSTATAAAALSNMTFEFRATTDAMAEFGFVVAVALGTEEACRAEEIGEAAMLRARIDSRS